MGYGRTIIRSSSVLVVVLLVLGGIAADVGTTAGTPPSPVPGAWKASSIPSGQVRGRFAVTRDKIVRNLTLTLSRDAFGPLCSGKVSVVGRHRIHIAEGPTPNGVASYWLVGTSHPQSRITIQTKKVTVVHNGRQVGGGLAMQWLSP